MGMYFSISSSNLFMIDVDVPRIVRKYKDVSFLEKFPPTGKEPFVELMVTRIRSPYLLTAKEPRTDLSGRYSCSFRNHRSHRKHVEVR